MNKELLYVDISKSKKEEDLIEIRLGNEEVAEINFSKLFNQSRYLRDKYKYSECIELIQEEIHHIKENTNVCDKSMKLFIELVSEDKIKFPIEHYKDIYTLSEYFCIPTITTELDKISRDKLFQDLNFTIQTLLDYERLNNNSDSKLQTKIESILKTRINECLSNPKFKELSNSTIFRILEGSKEEIDHNLLIEFIIESASTRFIMFKFIEIDKLRYDKFQLFIKFIENQEETNKKMYLDYIPFNFSFIQNILNKYDEVLKEMNEIKEELKSTKINENQTKEELNQIKKELKSTKINENKINEELNQAKEELKSTKINENQIKQELNQTKEELKETKKKLEERTNQEKRTKKELEECQREKKQAKDEINQLKSDNKKSIQSIIVSGLDQYNQLCEKPNNEGFLGDSIISPPVKLSFDPSSLLSYSVYNEHSVLVMSDGSLKGIGNNRDGRISATLKKTSIEDFTDFCIKDDGGRQLAAVSAVCYYYGTLYMLSKSSGNERKLVLCDSSINGGVPVFLDIGNHHPVSLFAVFHIQHLSAVKVKSFSSTVIQSKIHLNHESHQFLFQTVRKHRVSRAVIPQSLF